jgi:hypothetical protein
MAAGNAMSATLQEPGTQVEGVEGVLGAYRNHIDSARSQQQWHTDTTRQRYHQCRVLQLWLQASYYGHNTSEND